MNDTYYRWYDGHQFQYAASLAATWIWAPALLISSMQAYNNGLPGFLMFFIPNVLTLFLFGFIAKIVRKRNDGFTIVDALNNASYRQQRLHIIMSFLLLILSTCTQIVGINTALSYLIDNKFFNCILISALALAMVWKHGLKASIITDAWKYIILLICAIIVIIATNGNISFDQIQWMGHSGKTPIEVWWAFGFTTTFGLLSAPYIDSTFWQRAFSIKPEKIVPTFGLASVLFAVIPLLFGWIGFIEAYHYTGILQYVMLVAILCALISTLDSNLIAIAGFARKEFGFGEKTSKGIMVLVLSIACMIFLFDIFDLTKIFLSYNTVRVCMILPSLMIILNHFNEMRLFYATLLTCLICPVGYILTQDFKFTLLALFITVFGYKIFPSKS